MPQPLQCLRPGQGRLATLLSAVLAAGLLGSLPAAAAPAAPAGSTPATTPGSSVPELPPPADTKRPLAGTPRPPRAAAYDRFIVRYRGGAGSEQARRAARAVGTDTLPGRRLATGATVVQTRARLDAARTAAFLRALRADPALEYAEPDRLLTRTDVPSDPSIYAQWHYLGPAGGEPGGIKAPAAWDVARGNRRVVAVLDTGMTYHPDLAPNVVAGYDFLSDPQMARDGNGRDASPADTGDYVLAADPMCGDGAFQPSSWHGTHVAGTVAAVRDNRQGGAGVAPYARIQPVRVLGRCGGYTSDIADAVVWAAGGRVPGVPTNATPADVINMSLGGYGGCSPTMQAAINTASVYRGATVVVSAGNSADLVGNYDPASCNNVVTVAATDRAGAETYYTNYGYKVDLSAPGGDTFVRAADGVLSTINTGSTTPAAPSYRYYNGTSMAAPHVAGVAALLQGVRAAAGKPRFPPTTVEAIVKQSARPLPGGCDTMCGTGLLDATAAVTAAKSFK